MRLQRNCRDAQSLISAMDNFLTKTTFRDPGNLELKTFDDIVTTDDVWLWHYEVLTASETESKTRNPNSIAAANWAVRCW